MTPEPKASKLPHYSKTSVERTAKRQTCIRTSSTGGILRRAKRAPAVPVTEWKETQASNRRNKRFPRGLARVFHTLLVSGAGAGGGFSDHGVFEPPGLFATSSLEADGNPFRDTRFGHCNAVQHVGNA